MASTSLASTVQRKRSGRSDNLVETAILIPRLVRNAGWNLTGQAIPTLAALVSIPVLIHAIGDSRFGFLSIAWILVGYFGLADLGIGRGLTHGVARRLSGDADADVSDLVWSGLFVLGLAGLVAGGAVAASSKLLVSSFIRIEPDLSEEAVRALAILGLSIPVVVLSSGLRGLMPIGALLFLGPAVVAQFSVSLPNIMICLLVLRVAMCLLLFLLCMRHIKHFLRVRLRWSAVRELLSLGGWMTVSNVVSPVMVRMDRLFVSSLMSVSAVTYYVTPFEVVSKLLVVPSSIATASFPEFSRLARSYPTDVQRRYFMRTLALAGVLLVPLAALLFVVSHALLSVWISADLADRSAGIMRLLAAGIVINGVSYIPFAYVQGMGRSDITAWFHLLELVTYLPALYVMIGRFGLPGVALAWVLRVSLDALLLFGYSAAHLKRSAPLGPPALDSVGRP
ncbi:MAG: hypothetical protein AUH78_23100 [Gemmatimonadetes bacterium 13_1_40CM_4_69_8]|nr:MAG: hypothetical protein AUH78_23100 [Gemmatimonadetes bacterium 13_1_40CM_4_69_8]